MNIFGTEAAEWLQGSAADDYIVLFGGNDTVLGGAGNDSLEGGAGNDSMDGGAGDDVLWGDAGSNTLVGGIGNDSIEAAGSDKVFAGDGNDYVYALPGSGVIGLWVDGGAGNDTLVGSALSEWIQGGSGDDVVSGKGGNDTLAGGTGNDTLYGGTGNDTYVIDARTFVLVDGGGNDTAFVNVSGVKVPSSVENVVYGPGAAPLPYWIDAMLPAGAAGMGYTTLLGAARTFSYFFPAAAPAQDSTGAAGFTAFNASQQAAAVQALTYIDSVLDLRFVPGSDAAAANGINFYNKSIGAAAGLAYYPSSSALGSDVFLSPDLAENFSPVDGTSAALTLIHELGHALGLEHPNDYHDGAATSAPFLPGGEDRTDWTVMSYNRSPEQFHLEFGPLDLAALHYLYGPAPDARAGDDVYALDAAQPNFIWDGAGNDTLDASAQSRNLVVSLEPGRWGWIGSRDALITDPGQATVNFGTVIEALLGGSGNDALEGNGVANTLRGNAGNDTFTGGAGNDSIDGGAGSDTALFTGIRADYQLARGAAVSASDSVAGRDGSDALSGLELLRFADRSVDLTMAARAQALSAGTLKTLEELYVGFFNRIPEAQGLGWWIDQLATGMTLEAVADQFYAAGVAFGVYSAAMSDAQFVQTVYANVLARPIGSANAPSAQEIGYWTDRLAAGQATHGTMVLQMIGDVHSGFENHPVYGFVAASLDNKAAVANWHAVEQGLGLNVQADNIAFGAQMAALVTPTDTSAAIALVGLTDF